MVFQHCVLNRCNVVFMYLHRKKIEIILYMVTSLDANVMFFAWKKCDC